MDLSKTRVKEHYGIVTNETNTKKFNFLISPPKNRQSIQQQDLIVLDHPIYGDSCQIIAQVNEITSYEEVAGSTIGDRIGKMLATAEIVGYIDLKNEDKPLQKLQVPPNPGCRIYMPYTTFLEDAFSRDLQGKPYMQQINIGKTENNALTPQGTSQPLNYNINAQDYTSMHTLIAAVNGAGKTTTAKTLIQQLTTQTSMPIVIIDPNGEYANLAANNYTKTTITKMQETPKAQINQVTILNGQNIPLKEKNANFNTALSTLIKARLEKTIQPLMLLIEDAENLQEALQEILTTKIGITAILVCTHPTGLEPKTLTHMGNQIIGKTTDPTDIAYLRATLNCTQQELNSLKVGEFYINSLNAPYPTKVQITNSTLGFC
jgi:hypothetical protein